jgi:hypothetical protein
LAAREFAASPQHRIVKAWQLRLFGLINQQVRDAAELLPRYRQDNIFSSEKFKARFPEFKVTRIPEGLATIAEEWRAQKR